jgi:predicted translation initiation factor SUI1
MKLTGGKGWTLSSVTSSHPGVPSAASPKPVSAGPPKANIRIEKRAGKVVTVIAGLHTYGEARLTAIAKVFKARFGTGGTVKDGMIEIQGDRAQAVREWFAAKKDREIK